MAVNLKKGQRASIDNSMKLAKIGLGWDINRYDSGEDFDIDASVFLVGANGKVASDSDFVFYGNLSARDGAVIHSGDNLTGEGDGDDEQITIDFTKIPEEIEKIVVAVTIYDGEGRKQNFGQISNAFCRLLRLKDEFDEGIEELRFDLEDEFSLETGIVFCELYKKNGEWKFNAVAAGYTGGLETICKTYGVNI